MTSKEIYSAANEIVKEAYQKEDTNLNALVQMGFEMKDLNEGATLTGRVPNELYSMTGDDGNKVEVHYYAYDPTKAFGPIEQDINKFYVRLFNEEGKQIEESNVSFSDKP
ncbi:MAG TPA: hypothetical protein PLP23_23115 [Panacibacter sp.]|nr:hypothetical protein [Panacibacter sp.]